MFSVLQVNGKKEESERRGVPEASDLDLTVSRVDSIAEARDNLATGGHFDCIICHDAMDGEDGLALLKTLRKTGDTTPFIMVTNEENEQIVRKALQLGVNDILTSGETIDDALIHRLRDLKQKRGGKALQADAGAEISVSSHMNKLRSRVARLEKKENEYNLLLRLMGHDFREKINTITEFSRILEQDLDELTPDEARRHVKLIHKSSSSVKRMLDSLQDYQRAQLARLNPGHVNLSVIVSSLIDDLSTSHAGRVVRSCVASDLTVTADEALLHLCLGQLVNLVWQRTLRKAHTELTFGCYRTGEERNFFLSNNGEAISDSELEGAANPFAGRGADPRVGGASEPTTAVLSLATVERIIERHGGRVWYEDNGAGGTTVLFSLP